MSNVILSTHKLTKQYAGVTAAGDIDITVRAGEIYGLVGKNGAGKTTLLKMICGLSCPSSGQMELFGQTSGRGLDKARTRLGSMIETPSFFPYLSAKDNLEYYRLQRGIAGKACLQETLKFVGLADTGGKKFKNFSLGMKQRLGLALAIMGSPDLLVLDEPINGLDPEGIAEFRRIILKLNCEKNTTVIISSHILSELSQIATHYGFIDDGLLIENISSARLLEKCKHRLTVKVKDTGKAAVVLEKELRCTGIEILNENTLQLAAFLDAPERVNEVLVKNGVPVCGLELNGLNLEDYFLHLIGGGPHA